VDVSAVAATAVRGTWWRIIPVGGDPLWRPAEPPSNRWQHRAVVEGFYLADSPETAWAEWYRFLAEHGIPPLQLLPRDLWRYEVVLERVADLGDRDRLATVGLDPPRPRRADWAACQDAGDALFGAGWPALVAPSAARPSGRVLCVFRDRDELAGIEPIGTPQGVDQPPAPPRGMTT
jgi:RES domain-containing protein